MPRTIVTFNFGHTRRDPRVRRVAGTLVRAGHRVIVVESRQQDEAATEQLDGLEIRRVEIPRQRDRAAMAALRRIDPEIGDLIHALEPGLLDAAVGEGRSRPAIVERAVRLGRRVKRAVARRIRRPARISYSGASVGQELLRLRTAILLNLAFYRVALELQPDIVHSKDLDTLLAAVRVKRTRGAPIVYDAHEIYSEQYPPDVRSETWYRFFRAYEAALLPRSDIRLTVCDSLAAYFAEHFAAPGFRTILNVPSRRFLPQAEVLTRANRPRRILYHGLYAAYRGLDEVILAAKMVPPDEAVFVFRGLGAHEAPLKALAREAGVLDRLHFAPAAHVDQLVPLASECDIGLNPFVSVCLNTQFALPNKFFEYMMAGLAVASSDLTELRRITTELRVGALFPSLEPPAIAEALRKMVRETEQLETWRRQAYACARDQYHWEAEESKVLDLYRGL